MSAFLLEEAERLLLKHDPARFDIRVDTFPECIEWVRAVEDEQAWENTYPSLDAFYAAHEAKHPDIRYYATARREMLTDDVVKSPAGSASERLKRLRESE